MAANSSTLIDRRDYGLKIAMPGYDLTLATDNQTLFNSSFPILQIKVLASLKPDTLGGPANNSGEYCGFAGTAPFRMFVYRWYHGLGFPPFHVPLGKNSTYYGSYYSVDSQYIYRVIPEETDLGIPLDDGVKLLVCPIDISKDIEYPYTALPMDISGLYGQVGDYGFKSVEFGDIMTDDYDNLGINPRLQSQMLLAVKTMDTSVGTTVEYIVPDGLSIDDVMFYGFSNQELGDYDSSNPIMTWTYVGKFSQATPWLRVGYPDGNGAQIVPVTGNNASLVCTRQPMVAPVVTGVTV